MVRSPGQCWRNSHNKPQCAILLPSPAPGPACTAHPGYARRGVRGQLRGCISPNPGLRRTIKNTADKSLQRLLFELLSKVDFLCNYFHEWFRMQRRYSPVSVVMCAPVCRRGASFELCSQFHFHSVEQVSPSRDHHHHHHQHAAGLTRAQCAVGGAAVWAEQLPGARCVAAGWLGAAAAAMLPRAALVSVLAGDSVPSAPV